MDSNEGSIKVHLLDHQQLSPPKLIRRKKTLFVSFIVILSIIACSVILSSIIKKKKLSHTLYKSPYQSNSRKFYSHLTRSPKLCYESISSIINATDLESNPELIFSTSNQASFNELNNVTIAITRALSFTTNDSLSGPGLRACKARVLDLMSRINESLTLLSSDLGGVLSLSSVEIEKLQGWNLAAGKSALECSREMEEIGDEENNSGVDEVKSGVEIAMKCIWNSLLLLYRRDRIFSEFYSPVTMETENWVYELYYSHYDYRFLVCLYSGMYLFIALLYFVFWRSV